MATKKKASDAELLALREANVPFSAIMEHFGYTNMWSLRVRERKLGLPPRKRGGGPRPKPTVDEVLRRPRLKATQSIQDQPDRPVEARDG